MSFVKRQYDAEIKERISLLNHHFRKALTGDQIRASGAAYRSIGSDKAKFARSIAALPDDGLFGCSGRIMWRSRWLIWKILCCDRDGLHLALYSADPECDMRFMFVTTAEEDAESRRLAEAWMVLPAK